MSDLYIRAYAASNIGKRRQNNEDNYYLNRQFVNSEKEASAELLTKNSFIASVCDGMGGEEAGEVASQIAVETVDEFSDFMVKNGFSDRSIEAYINRANDLICGEISKRKKRTGTTFALLGIKDHIVTASNIGDSRIYRYSDGTFEQISRDHTAAQLLIDTGAMTYEEAMNTAEKHQLTQHLGIFPYEMVIEPHTVRIRANPKDRYLLCSDGLTDMLTNAKIANILSKEDSLPDTVNRLIESAIENGGKDNVTVLLCEISQQPF